MAVNNSTILDRVWLEGTWEYQQRVPQATQQGVAAVAEFLFDPLNKMYYNQFVDALINRIGMTRINSKLWENPWSTFKKGNLPFGSTVQDMGVKWLKAHTYEDDLDSLLEIKRPEIEPAYYTLNRRDQYTISVNYDELRNAFVDEYGLNRLINTITDVPISSDNYDEYQSMKALVAEYEARHGFYKEQITAITNEATAKEFLVKARAYAGKLKFPSVYYNIIDIPAFAEESELVLLIDPTSLAYIDVEALAAAFNIDKANIKYRVELVDEWPIPGAVALLTTEDFFQVYDVLYTTTSFYNPQNLTTNYYLTHWEILAFSPFVPAILFTTEQGTGIDTVTQSVSGFGIHYILSSGEEFGGMPAEVTRTKMPDGILKVLGTLQGSLAPTNAYFADPKPDSFLLKFNTRGAGQSDTPCSLTFTATSGDVSQSYTVNIDDVNDIFVYDIVNSELKFDYDNLLNRAKESVILQYPTDNIAISSLSCYITGVAVATYINPSGEARAYTSPFAFTILADA